MNAVARRRPMPSRPRGAVLYVALIMLILLALIGIAGMQVAGMQEKMASNYLVTNIAFQNAEGVTRRSERAIEAIANRKSAPSDATVVDTDIQQNCDTAFDPVAWARNKAVSVHEAVNVRRIESCIIGGGSLAMGNTVDPVTPVYQITTFANDATTDASSSASIDSIFKL
ncbi:pilus assembly PilX family protein [Xanthomonas oryzae pv. oryzicola]|uniref:PilX n=1 Tax=Xanthomonas oryzae pv. oryzicola (strain BLS256) TaxID=383407 RepID=G7TK69_XANOB|nr:PilX N-terminal domain-containing pilus assembly protein [Xanthomonas oryzae]AEQ97002.1 PilX [Xanthomonas oryzae pv. oryzicola BLS256]AJQ88097.1 pilus assembly protein [Xanthomonas oryzae pv. oryzicola]AKK64544.1 pilus assembly protein [Xanthomonas oryzae pv. oryzicola]AKN93849.1 pilus assembly protein [Xanthomonas oryzae pv. oryzicola]AKN97530.1 pilus assembly protein [Xanthomonas oryzae pv. oryzicola]